MKKNLQKVLILALGLTTTIASAQDFNVDSRTRVNNTDSEARTAEQRLTVGASWGGSDWGIHASSDMSYDVANGATTRSVYEAYVSTDVMGYGTLTIGRQDLSFGSGALISSNSWGMERYTNDGMDFAANFGGFDINLGTIGGINMDNNYLNASGEFGGATFNVLMLSNAKDETAHGYDLGYSLMGGDLSLSYSMNADYEGDDMTTMGATYNVFENLTASVSRTTYGDGTLLSEAIAAVTQVGTAGSDSTFAAGTYALNTSTGDIDYTPGAYEDSSYSEASLDYVAGVVGADAVFSSFAVSNTEMSGGFANGVLGYQAAGTEVTSLGFSYDLGDITLGYITHSLSNEAWEGDQEASTISIGYTLNDNTSIGLKRITQGVDETNFISINIGL
jgi:hypothetical protein